MRLDGFFISENGRASTDAPPTRWEGSIMPGFLTFKKSNCKNCHKCIRHCPVKSIRFSGNQANVIADACVLCGQCYVICPQDAKQIVDNTEVAKVILSGDAPVYASVAPSFVAYFEETGIENFRKALKKLGFADAEETAIGATIVKREYERLLKEGDHEVIITSCCHTVNSLIQKHYPQLSGCLAQVVTPMEAHCHDILRRHPDAKTIFIGPCLSKKEEASLKHIDLALTFEEIEKMLVAAGIEIEKGRETNDETRARLFPTDGGILKTLTYRNPDYTYAVVSGMDNCMAALDDIDKGRMGKVFIEMSACAGSCINGPVIEKKRNFPLRHYTSVIRYAGDKDFPVEQPPNAEVFEAYNPILLERDLPTEGEIKDILKKMGKTSKEDELNCGSCGYNTCREKAIAIHQGKAEINMCLPYLMEKAERFSNSILDNTPNGILVVNEELEVQQINRAAMRMLRVQNRGDVLGGPLVRIMNPTDFVLVHDCGARVVNKRDYYAEYGAYFELTIVQDKVVGNMMGILRDVTNEETARHSKEEIRRQTVETADKVVDKQMRIVQEIASLLGETAAETKIALTKLKESISNEDEE